MHTVIVGGTRGLGRAAVRHFSSLGHDVSVIGKRPPAAADEGLPGVRIWQSDLSDAAAVEAVLSEIAARGPINYVVLLQRFKGEGDAWAGEMATTVNATRLVIETLSASFASEGDKAIVLVGSVVGQFIAEGQPVGYHVAKGALAQMARFYAVALGKSGIRVNCVSPGTFVKEENAEYYLTKNPPLLDLFTSTVPLGRMGTAEDSVGVMGFLCSPAAAFVTGQEILVDGGVSLLSQEALARKVRGV